MAGPRLLHYSDVENAYDTPERIGRLAGTLQARRDAHPDATLVCGTGDNVAPGVLALTTRGAQALDFFEAVDTDVETFGNHDFDFGPGRTHELVARSPQQWVTANVREGDARFATDHTVPWTVRDAGGATVGFVGVTSALTASINPETTALGFTDPVVATREAMAELRAAHDPDYVVALSHLGRDDERLAAETDVDVVLGGHLHAETVERFDDTVLTRPGVNGAVCFEVLPGTGEVRRHAVDEGPLDAALADHLRERMTAAGLDEVVAHVDEPVPRTEGDCFRGESRIGNFVADAYLRAAREAGVEADLALQNSGGVRSGPPLAGDVTVGDLVSVVPFEEPTVVLELDGALLRRALAEAGGADVGFGARDWWHGHVAGAELVYDYRGHELVDARVGGRPIDPDRTYRLVTADCLRHIDDEFPALSGLEPLATLGTQYQLLVDYARSCGVAPAIEGRIERRGV
ncbi:bifunctional metallophosphatase/5'-nucleotidase [Halobacteriales archaeon QS_4_70_19]|nr:MAG: bifunctional metallophosphatase/5'-nucleotidase [Halobacteriales archaeon QS_4_70_19]